MNPFENFVFPTERISGKASPVCLGEIKMRGAGTLSLNLYTGIVLFPGDGDGDDLGGGHQVLLVFPQHLTGLHLLLSCLLLYYRGFCFSY